MTVKGLIQKMQELRNDPIAALFLKAAEYTHDLYELDLDGKNDSPEADAVRDKLESLWKDLTPPEQEALARLSAMLKCEITMEMS